MVDNKMKSSAESIDSGSTGVEVRGKQKDTKEIKDASRSVEAGAGDIIEGAEFSNEAVSEANSEDKKRLADGSMTGGTTTSKATGTRKNKIMPVSIDILRTQIHVKVEKEIVQLEKEAVKYMSARNFEPHMLNQVVGKIRRLKEILAALSYATIETLKNWWLEFVKN